MTEPLVSVIVPVYKVEKYLSNCIESVINQTYSNWELILVDDGSPDRSGEIADMYAERDSRIKVVHQKNAGVSAARNLGVCMATGKYVLFLDADDYLDGKFFDIISQYIGKYDVIHWSYKKVTSKLSIDVPLFDTIKKYYGEECKNFYSRLIGPIGTQLSKPEQIDSFNPLWLKLYRLDIIRDNNIVFEDIYKIGSSEDLLFNIMYFKHVNSIVCIPDCLYAYRRDNSQSYTSICKTELINQWSYLYSLIYNNIIGDKHLEKCLSNRKALGAIGILLNEHGREKGILNRYRNYKSALGADIFKGVFDKLDVSYMPIHWKVFFLSIKYNQFFSLTFLVEVIQLIRKFR